MGWMADYYSQSETDSCGVQLKKSEIQIGARRGEQIRWYYCIVLYFVNDLLVRVE